MYSRSAFRVLEVTEKHRQADPLGIEGERKNVEIDGEIRRVAKTEREDRETEANRRLDMIEIKIWERTTKEINSHLVLLAPSALSISVGLFLN